MKESITNQRKWNLIAGGSDPANDVVSAELCQGIEDAMLHAISELNAANQRIKRLEEAGDGLYEAWRGYGFTKDNRLAAWRKAKETQ